VHFSPVVSVFIKAFSYFCKIKRSWRKLSLSLPTSFRKKRFLHLGTHAEITFRFLTRKILLTLFHIPERV
jgi:hypothetical protein